MKQIIRYLTELNYELTPIMIKLDIKEIYFKDIAGNEAHPDFTLKKVKYLYFKMDS